MKLTCLCITYGRFTRLRDALACFLAQDTTDAKLIIYNFADEPLMVRAFDYRHGGTWGRRVEIVNEPNPGDVHAVWTRALELVDTEFVKAWYDDDWNLPWACRQGLENIGDAPCWKTTKFFQVERGQFTLTENVAEGAYIIRTDAARAAGLHPENDGLFINGIVATDLPPSWCFNWNDGLVHSESIDHVNIPIAERNRIWRAGQRDFGAGLPLTPTDMNPHWRRLLAQHPDMAAHFVDGGNALKAGIIEADFDDPVDPEVQTLDRCCDQCPGWYVLVNGLGHYVWATSTGVSSNPCAATHWCCRKPLSQFSSTRYVFGSDGTLDPHYRTLAAQYADTKG